MDTPADLVLERAHRYRYSWRDMPETYWFYRLLEEVHELNGAVQGYHEHSVKLELLQIAAICLNWLDMIGGTDARTALACDRLDGP